MTYILSPLFTSVGTDTVHPDSYPDSVAVPKLYEPAVLIVVSFNLYSFSSAIFVAVFSVGTPHVHTPLTPVPLAYHRYGALEDVVLYACPIPSDHPLGSALLPVIVGGTVLLLLTLNTIFTSVPEVPDSSHSTQLLPFHIYVLPFVVFLYT